MCLYYNPSLIFHFIFTNLSLLSIFVVPIPVPIPIPIPIPVLIPTPIPQFNVGEAVNFASHDWLLRGSEAEQRYRHFARESVFSHQRLLFTLLNHSQDLTKVSLLK
jgi:hypothetical protein